MLKSKKPNRYLRLDDKTALKISDILGVFDMDTATVSPNTKKFLKLHDKNKNLTSVGYELPKSFIVCGGEKVYVSEYSVSAVKNRIKSSIF